ncbi:MAG: hypothetical protein FP826_11205 [Sphingomonadales bacterium]|nr:hypothetical protein [Sphingomonadales bacterium]MBU3992719.1 hypothetical protein [Alphaproteobacteria bacterium]
MTSVRAFLLNHRRFAALLIALALCMKVALPAGFMLGTGSMQLTIEICNSQGQPVLSQIAVPLDGKSAPGQAQHKGSSDCPFSALSMATMAGADALLIGAALAFIIALGFAPVASAPLLRIPFLSPPLRGPPALS